MTPKQKQLLMLISEGKVRWRTAYNLRGKSPLDVEAPGTFAVPSFEQLRHLGFAKLGPFEPGNQYDRPIVITPAGREALSHIKE